MIDDERLSDADLALKVAAHDPELGKLVRARLVRLRLRCIVTPLGPAGDPASQLPAMAAAIATNGGAGQSRQF